MYKYFLGFILIFHFSNTHGQGLVAPIINEKIQDYEFAHVVNYKKPTLRISDFKGKWLFLDFWSLRCRSCIASFPKVGKIQKQFKDQVQFVMVGNNDKYNRGIEKVYEKFRLKYDLDMIAVYDSVLQKEWEIKTVPHIYIIDPEGKVRFITTGIDLKDEKIAALINGKEVSFHEKDIVYFDFIDTEGTFQKLSTENLLEASLISKWNGESVRSGYDLNLFSTLTEDYTSKGWYTTAVPLYQLYKYAYVGGLFWMYYDTLYHGKYWLDPIIEVKDATPFQYDFSTREGKGLYNVYVKLTHDSVKKGRIKDEVQKLLQNNFGYKAYIEEREMPIWKLVLKPSKSVNVISNTKTPYITPPPYYDGFTAKNISIDRFLHMVTFNLDNPGNLSYINDTGIQSNIDVSIKADMTDIESVRKSLHKHGFDLVKGVKKMKVLIITDP